MDFYVDVNGTIYPDTDGLDKVKRDIAALFEDKSFGFPDILTLPRKEEMKKNLKKFVWEGLPKDLQLKVAPPQVIFNEDGTTTFKFHFRTAI